MARSLGLTAYRALARRAEAPGELPFIPRPVGELLWIHAGEPENLLAVQDLAQRLVHARRALNVLITVGEAMGSAGLQPPAPINPKITQIAAPSDHPSAVTGFLSHWKPAMGIWVWGGLKPNLILAAADAGSPLILIDADTGGFDRRSNRWLPDLTRQVLSRFDTIFARSAEGRRRLLQIGVDPDMVRQSTPLLAGGQTLSCAETNEVELSVAMGGRPAWFAANVQPQEIGIVLAAHRQASRLSHRLLLILQPAPGMAAEEVKQIVASEGLQVHCWSEGTLPDETVQVLISDDPEDRGLFFRVAPVSFLGSTLVLSDGGCDPLDAAALGSAILYGPKVRHFMPSYSRLAAAGAARIVNDADALGAAVTSLIAPDHAATMAHAGWDVISQGAALSDAVIELAQDTLDTLASRH